jgi:cobalt-zinc-cadmium efflux system membrane fusion protein
MDVASDDAPADGTKVRLRSVETARLAGIETVKASPAREISEIFAPATIAYDASRIAQVNARSPGVVKRLYADIGTWVEAGAPLMMIESAAVSADQSRLAAVRSRVGVAEKTYGREARLEKKGISAKQEVLAAEQELREARAEYEALRASLGIVGANGGSGGRYTLSAPFSGMVTQRNVSLDRYVDSETTLFEIVDTSSMWAEVALPETALGSVGLGRPVVLTVDGLDGREFGGIVSHIAPQIDRETRTVKARVRLENPDGLLRANMYGRARIAVAVATRASAAIPRDAIQRAKTVQLAFVRLAPDEYEARRVQLTANSREGDLVEVRSGLEPGEEVVVAGSFFLKTETLKDSIGAGCCDLDLKKEG